MTESTSVSTRYVLSVQDKRNQINQHVVVKATSKEEAREKFDEQYDGYEVKVTTIPNDGSAWETVFSRSESAAKRIASSRSGEYSEVIAETVDLSIPVEITNTTIVADSSSRVSELAADENLLESSDPPGAT